MTTKIDTSADSGSTHSCCGGGAKDTGTATSTAAQPAVDAAPHSTSGAPAQKKSGSCCGGSAGATHH